jgi:hypothetical protein
MSDFKGSHWAVLGEVKPGCDVREGGRGCGNKLSIAQEGLRHGSIKEWGGGKDQVDFPSFQSRSQATCHFIMQTHVFSPCCKDSVN